MGPKHIFFYNLHSLDSLDIKKGVLLSFVQKILEDVKFYNIFLKVYKILDFIIKNI